MNPRKKRQNLIIELINKETISTQEELLIKLKESGIDVTQATVSRDIKDLKLIKKVGQDGRSKYAINQTVTDDYLVKYYTILSGAVISVDYAVNTSVIKCYAGMAMAACAAIDSMEWEGVVGTLAGDDTIFVLCRTEQAAKQLKESVEKMINI
ncbi:MAG: arginine repressor [Clostridiales bacterium]|nr:arginine repressor [Clostridiales bacterium]